MLDAYTPFGVSDVFDISSSGPHCVGTLVVAHPPSDFISCARWREHLSGANTALCVCVCVCACMRACVCVCAHARMHMCTQATTLATLSIAYTPPFPLSM